jgi:cytochrome oxidase Cu insertion factor (SCO1/SenC/PrrC family)
VENRVALARGAGAVPRGPLLALGAVAVITVAWWTAALWPLPANTPAWVARARSVCFGTGADGLPDTAGWLALILEPAVMLAIVLGVWGRSVRYGIGGLARSPAGRALLAGVSLMVVTGASLAVWRVHAARAAAVAPLPGGVARVDRPAPELRLVSQHGPFDLSLLRGRPVLVTFAFAHCRTVCPLLVRDALAVRRAAGPQATAIVVVTLDPWRDTPSRLTSIAERWELGENAWVLSGPVADVNRALDRWEVARSRSARDGDIVHAPVTYLVDSRGVITHRSGGNADALIALLGSS